MDINFGERIKYLRTQRGLTQTALAGTLGVTKTMVSSYESGIRRPSYETLMHIALYFGVSMDWLFGNADAGEFFIVNLTQFTSHQRNLLMDMAKIMEENNAMEKPKEPASKEDPRKNP